MQINLQQSTSSTATTVDESPDIKIQAKTYNDLLQDFQNTLTSARLRRNIQKAKAKHLILTSGLVLVVESLVLILLLSSRIEKFSHNFVKLFVHPKQLTRDELIKLIILVETLIFALVLASIVASILIKGVIYAQRSRQYHFSDQEIKNMESAITLYCQNNNTSVGNSNDFVNSFLKYFKEGKTSQSEDTMNDEEQRILLFNLLHDTYHIHVITKSTVSVLDLLALKSQMQSVKNEIEQCWKDLQQETTQQTKQYLALNNEFLALNNEVKNLQKLLKEETEQRLVLQQSLTSIIKNLLSGKTKKKKGRDAHDGTHHSDSTNDLLISEESSRSASDSSDTEQTDGKKPPIPVVRTNKAYTMRKQKLAQCDGNVTSIKRKDDTSPKTKTSSANKGQRNSETTTAAIEEITKQTTAVQGDTETLAVKSHTEPGVSKGDTDDQTKTSLIDTEQKQSEEVTLSTTSVGQEVGSKSDDKNLSIMSKDSSNKTKPETQGVKFRPKVEETSTKQQSKNLETKSNTKITTLIPKNHQKIIDKDSTSSNAGKTCSSQSQSSSSSKHRDVSSKVDSGQKQQKDTGKTKRNQSSATRDAQDGSYSSETQAPQHRYTIQAVIHNETSNKEESTKKRGDSTTPNTIISSASPTISNEYTPRI